MPQQQQQPQPTNAQVFLDGLKPAASSYTSRFSAFSQDNNNSSKTKDNTKPYDQQDTSSPSKTKLKTHIFPVTEAERTQVRATAVSHSNDYYNIVSRRYEFGWSQHFHWTPFAPGDSISHSLRNYVHRLAVVMGLKRGMRVLDVGCGIGAPAREVARLVGCEVVGVTINQWQVDRAIELTMLEGMGHLCTFIRGDFMRLDERFPGGWFDAVMGCEATCHAPSLEGVYGQVWHVLKEGGVFGFTEELMDDSSEGRWDETSERFRNLRNNLEVGGGMASLQPVSVARAALLKAGFTLELDEDYSKYFDCLSQPPKVVFAEDGLALGEIDVERNTQNLWEGKQVKSFSTVKLPTRDGNGWYYAPPPSSSYEQIRSSPKHPIPPTLRPWYYPIMGTKEAVQMGVTDEDRKRVSFMSHGSRRFYFTLVNILVWLGICSPGEAQLNKMMELYCDACVEAGKENIFAPCWMFVGRKDEGLGDATLLASQKLANGLAGAELQSGPLSARIDMATYAQLRRLSNFTEEENESRFGTPQTEVVDIFDGGVSTKP
ncbi:Delta(24)-sterol C-methyltransferase [Lithohypha guttulata]|uniref:Delta(24)-sterol C-methyltransferase n=1 Tax=Lithohypha guttulata TaxID=1690604 RepID=A0AAN7T1F9_9EURO|nr:Delta(24)-sterol C-methyltransferase [Lithohypha guttulata]